MKSPKIDTFRAKSEHGLTDTKKPVFAGKKIHFIGAGGVGMSGLAKLVLKNKGSVCGSDNRSTELIKTLCESGCDVKIGHKAENLHEDTDIVVASAAVDEDNPELRLARKRGLKVYKYAQMLGEIMNHYQGLAIAGTHGKSTTSGWLTYCLRQSGLDCSFVVGAAVSQLCGSSGAGTSEYFVAEACEYDRSFHNLRPYIGCILNIEQDHLDYYSDIDDIVDAFKGFTEKIKKGGMLVINADDGNCRKILELIDIGCIARGLKIKTFGFSKGCDYRADNIEFEEGKYRFDVYKWGDFVGRITPQLPGRHNILNALAAAAIADNLGVSSDKISRTMSDFGGVDRRLMFKNETNGITVLDDYAHHPTEIKASLKAIRRRYTPKRLWCVFQPHQYSRTRFLLDDFAQSFKLADATIVPDIYFVRDSQDSPKKVNSEILVEKIKEKNSNAFFIDSFKDIVDFLQENAAPGDVVVTMGAGNIWKVADEYIQRIGRNS